MTRVVTVSSLSEAAAANGAILGGGTLLMRQVNDAPQEVPNLVQVTDPALRSLTVDSQSWHIGAGVTMAEIIAHPDLAALHPVARSIGGPALRNMASVGGNLFAPHPYGDFAVALLALGAEVVWSDGRTQDIETVLRDRATVQGVVQSIRVPKVAPDALKYRKVSRTKPKGISVMSIAVHLETSGGVISAARVAFGAMGPRPMRAPAAEAALRGARLDTHAVAAACAACARDLAPFDDAIASAWYRTEVAPVHLRRCLLGEI
ncbi:MAG: xanthine dehydrogenase family protein subunit M [Roseobacter sp.]